MSSANSTTVEARSAAVSFGPILVALNPEKTRLGMFLPWHVMAMEMAMPDKRDVIHVHLACGAVTRQMIVYGEDIEALRGRVWAGVTQFVAEAMLGQLAQRSLPDVIQQIAALSISGAGEGLAAEAERIGAELRKTVPELVVKSLESLAGSKKSK